MNSKKNLKRNLLICLLAGSAVMYTLPLHAATSVIANNTLPTGGKVMAGNITLPNWVNTPDHGNLVMDITQSTTNGVIKWDSFDVGGSATVNFKGPQVKGGYNTLNYVNAGGSMSQIYGTINANNNGNIFIVNPAGVQIGNSAQINVGSLYVSNKNLDNVNWEKIDNVNPDINSIMGQGTTGDAVLMSLGNINAGKVTFEGNGRIVIDSERLLNSDGNSKNTNFEVHTDDAGNVLIGYDAYVDTDKDGDGHIDGYKNQDRAFNQNVFVNGQNPKDNVKGYMWVEDVKQLQAINTNLSGNYALRNSIDATATSSWNNNEGFNPIGLDEIGKLKYTGFTGKFDGIDYNIFGLTINNNYTNVGLFGGTNGATINNVTLVGGSIIGGAHVGALVGSALNGTVITNVVNSASVSGSDNTGGDNIGGVVGVADNSTITNAVNTGAVDGKNNNVGGLVGLLENDSTLNGNSYNLGDVSGDGYNVGGLVGHAVNSTIGDGKNLVYNRLDVEGAYNVGGIVGNMKGTTVQNAENSGNVTASDSLTDEYNYHTDITDVNKLPDVSRPLNNGIVSIDVNVANVGGIAGSSSGNSIITDVLNTGDISSGKGNGKENINNLEYNYEYYTAGNVGGIVGSAVNTDITNATNKENSVRGAHNVGGVVGYFSGTGTIDKGINDGGDIMATGARNGNRFVMESVRQSGDEDFIIGNIGGIVGYMEGKGVKVTGSANRGTVHTENIEDADNVLTISKAANVGGIVGKIDANTNENGLLSDFRNGNYKNASVSNSYNTGNVTGYTGVGGVIGMMYNGSVAGSYNQGAINTTRQVDRGGGSNIDPLNMGGIVGDTTEQTSASAVIYDVYNEGQIGDENFEFYARHVGGIVGRLSGTVEKAYNTGDIYNNDTAVGGIVGWWYNGNIKNVFNTGNITVRSATELQVGGIAGAAETGYKTLENAYNLGTIRGYKEGVDVSNNPQDGTDDYIYVGGIIGRARGYTQLTIRNVYTMGNLYAGVGDYDENTNSYSYTSTANGLGAIYGGNEAPTLQGANYIVRDIDYKDYFKDLSGQNYVNDIEYGNRYKKGEYVFVNVGTTGDIIFDQKEQSGAVEGATDDNWRIYEGSTTPILNAFLPNTEKYFDNKNLSDEGITSIQYGTAYDPLLTIINAKRDLSYDWNELGISGAASLAVYGGGLTLDNVDTSSGNGYYSGLLYTDKDLTLIATNKNNEPDETKVSGDIGLGSGAELYGSSVKIEADGTVTVYGSVTATGETADLTGDINITAGDVDVYGTLTTGKPVSIAGIEDSAHDVDTNFEHVNNPNEAMIHISERFAHEINSVNGATSNITINAGTKLVVGDDGKPILDAEGNKQYVNIGDGNVNLYFGNKEQGLITTEGDLTVTGTGDVYVDSDLDIGDDLTLNGTDADSEVVLDITNIGQVQAKNELAENPDSNVTAAEKLHEFMHHFENTNADMNNLITLNSASGNAKLAVDMWDGNAFNLSKFDSKDHNFKNELDSMNVTINGKELDGKENNHVKDYTYIWVSDGEQLKGIQQSAKVNNDFLDFNFALKNDINASDIGNGYEAIGGTTGYNGTFDGRGNRIIGLTVSGDNAGIFSTIGNDGTVKNLNVYSGTFTGTDTAGAVAGINNGTIENITAFGNTVTVTGNDGNAGGIAGTNSGIVDDVESSGSVIAEDNNAIVGGLVGTNESDATVKNSYSNSAVTSTSGTDAGLGGVVGVNKGTVSLVDSLGVTNGTNSTNVGGVIGINSGTLSSAYNESIVNGYSNVGGIIGDNDGSYDDYTDTWTGGIVENVVNATGVTGTGDYVGGLVGTNIGSVENGRNNGTITGTNYVGGMVGSNADEHSILANLTNDSAADISGENYVGGIAGTNSGTITAQNQSNLINRGSITGQNYVGGVAGENIGTIEYVKNDVNLYVKDSEDTARYFGGVAGINGRVDDTSTTDVNEAATGTITSATNEGDVVAENAQYVGGIVGWNTVNGILDGMGNSNTGRVEGATYVGGVAGKNDADITGDVDNIVTIENSGVVIAHNGGAGGIFGQNTGDITYAEMSNSGIVSGTNYSGSDDVTNGTGGIIGVNSGDITYSSITNTVDGQVTGINNVGGLIGYNTGTIIGGRNEAQETDEDGNVTAENDSYYKYQIYNNGTITVTGSGSNIGGLIGNNAKEIVNGAEQTGSLTAGYNTGVINASGSTTVGGIAGSNSGTIDQVFNTVYNTDGTKGAITGGTNVGGLVGTNSGMLSNAYNTTDVFGNSVFGNAVGNNTAKGTIKNIYASNNSGKLIGENINQSVDAIQNAYSFVNGDTSATKIISGEDQKDSGSYDGFDFSAADVDGDAADWKNYDGYSNPLLKVFLTKAKYTGNESFTYNGQDQGLTINGNVSAADKLDAYNNANSLLQATQNKNAGQDYLGIYSQQIAASGSGDTFNPNNLGYDIDVTYAIDKATITINLDEISRDYGNSAINNVTSGGNNYGFNFGNMVLTDEMKADLTADNIGFTQTSDGAVDNLKGGQKTNNADTYNWYANFKLSDALSANYQFDTQGADSLTSVKGVSKVNQVQLTIDLKDITRVYGNLDKADYEFIAKGLVNGDNIEDLILTVTADGAIVEGSTDNPLKTNVVGDYEWSATVSNISNNLNTNYIIKIDASAKSTVTPAQLDVVLGDVSHVYGSPNLNGYAASFGNNNGLVNGDSGSISVNVGSVTDEALSADKQYTNDVDNYHWTVGEGGLSGNGFDLGNYTVHYVDKGNSKVTPAQLDVVLGDVSHVYGSPNLNGYAASFGNNNGLVNGDSGIISVNVDRVTDEALSADKQYTNDVDNYHWTVGEGGLSADGFKLGNYAINFVNEGSSKVTKANLTININDVNMTYGDLENWISGQYGYNASDVDGQKLVNGDSLADVIAGMTYNNTAYNSDGTTKNVAEGNFAITNDDVTQGTKYGNYNITFNNGTVTMDKKQITIGANNEQILVGETPNYSGTDIDSVLVNGDSLNGNYYYGVADGTIESVVGAHNGVIGVWIGGAFYDLSQNVDWTQAGNFFSNYEVNYIPGTLTVSAYDIPEDWPHNRWDYLFNDAPFDRNKDFRERKAEVNFVDGGMEI